MNKIYLKLVVVCSSQVQIADMPVDYLNTTRNNNNKTNQNNFNREFKSSQGFTQIMSHIYSVSVDDHEFEILVVVNVRRHIIVVLLELLPGYVLILHTNFKIMM